VPETRRFGGAILLRAWYLGDNRCIQEREYVYYVSSIT
jgi:hypothetical protein